MSKKTNAIIGVAGSALLLGSMGASAALAMADEQVVPIAGIEEAQQVTEGTRQAADKVLGTFTFTQTGVDSLDKIAKMARQTAYLCQSVPSAGQADASQWTITVSGDVENAFTATKEELEAEGRHHATMGCSCGGNPAGGTASVNAEVAGIPVQTILEMARPDAEANTIVFTSADGYETALPLFYVRHHYSLIVWEVNGQPIADSMGGVNQLWLGSTPAFAYVRDVTSVTFETRQTPPPTPGLESRAEGNLPNVSVTEGTA